MKMQTLEIHRFATLQKFYNTVELMPGYTELVFLQTGGHVLMRVSIDIGINTHGSIDPNPFRGRDGVYHFELHQRLDMETADSQINRARDFPVGLAHAGENDGFRAEPVLHRVDDFVPADAISAKAFSADYL